MWTCVIYMGWVYILLVSMGTAYVLLLCIGVNWSYIQRFDWIIMIKY